jgi:hypothetical protein
VGRINFLASWVWFCSSSSVAAEGAIANAVGMTQMNPPVKDLGEFIFILPSHQLLM